MSDIDRREPADGPAPRDSASELPPIGASAPPRPPAAGPRVILPHEEVQQRLRQLEGTAQVVHRRPVRGAVLALVLALAGAGVWIAITELTGYQLGIVAIVIGLLAGVGARQGGPGRAAQVTGAICAAIGFFAGQMGLILAFMLTHAAELQAAASQPSEPVAAQVRVDSAGDASAAPAEAAASQPGDGEAPLTLAEWLRGLSQLIGALFLVSVQSTFSSIEVLFLGIAVYEGYRIPSAG